MIEIKIRLNYLRKQIENECISYGEIAELQSLSKYIDKGDTLLLEWAGIEEFENSCQCVSCEKTFNELTKERTCPYCGSGNWVYGYIDEEESK